MLQLPSTQKQRPREKPEVSPPTATLATQVPSAGCHLHEWTSGRVALRDGEAGCLQALWFHLSLLLMEKE